MKIESQRLKAEKFNRSSQPTHFEIEKWRARKISHLLNLSELVRSSFGTIDQVFQFLAKCFIFYCTFSFCFSIFFFKKGETNNNSNWAFLFRFVNQAPVSTMAQPAEMSCSLGVRYWNPSFTNRLWPQFVGCAVVKDGCQVCLLCHAHGRRFYIKYRHGHDRDHYQ